MNSALTIHGVPDWHTRKQHRATLERTTDVCDRLQAAMFHLANDRGDLARRSLRSAFALHERMVRHHCIRPRELDTAVAAGIAWVVTPQSYRTLVALCHVTICLVEWRALRFTETRYIPAARSDDAS